MGHVERIFDVLYVAYRYEQPTESLLMHILQLYTSAGKTVPDVYDATPLKAGMKVDKRVLQCLLSADLTSVEGVFVSICCCLRAKQLTHRVEAVKLLLEANPQAAYRVTDGETLAYVACENSGIMSAQECVDILKLLVKANKNAFGVAAELQDRVHAHLEELPVHALARFGPVEALEFLLDACPKMLAATVTTLSDNLLHCVVRQRGVDTVAKARLLCARYPAMKVGLDNQGKTALHVAASISLRHGGGGGLVQALCETDGHLVASTPVVHPTDADYPRNGWLPLHMFIDEFHHPPQRADQALVPWEDALRTLLRVYPYAAGAVVGTMREFPPLGVKFMKLPPPFRRLVLDAARRLDAAGGDGRNAAPRHDKALLKDLTWKARENAAVSIAAVWWASLREAEGQGAAAGHGGAKAAVLMNKDLVKNIMSYV